ncbi:17247_t:CDS:2, partial [Racocetra fulgida]
PSNEHNIKLFDRSKKLPKISQSEQTIATESEELSNQSSDDIESASSISFKCSFQEQDTVKKQITCDVVIINLDRNEKNCDKIFSITTSTTHLGEHLNEIHRIFSNQQYSKNSKRQATVESDKSTPTIPSILSKVNSHSPAKQKKLTYHLISWIVKDCQPLTVVDKNEFRLFYQEMDPHFKVSCSASIKTKIRESVLFAEEQLRRLISKTMESFCFITDIMRLLEVPHIRYTAHTIQLAIKDSLNLCDDLLTKAKKLNNWLVKQDRYLDDSEPESDDSFEFILPQSTSQVHYC